MAGEDWRSPLSYGGKKQITDLIFDYYILEEIQNISSPSSEFSLIGLLLLLLLDTKPGVVWAWQCGGVAGGGGIQVYKS